MGVHDNGTVKGLTITNNTATNIHQSIRDNTHDPGRYELHMCKVGERPIVVVAVASRVEGIAQTNDGGIYIRRGGSSLALLGEELRDIFSRRSLSRFEATPTEIPQESADVKLLRQLAGAYGWGEANLGQRLREKALSTEDPAPCLTVAGALYLVKEPHNALAKAFVEVFRYPDESSDYDQRIQYGGPLTSQVSDATAFVLAELGYEFVVSGLLRHQLPRLPEVVLREAIANAVAHRSYERTGESVRVELRPGRVVITSPGGLPDPVTLENLRVQSAARNPRVIDVLRRFRLAEDAGRGIGVMQDEMEVNLLEPPEFHTDGSSVTAILRTATTVTPQERAWVRHLGLQGALEPKDNLLLVKATRGEILTNATARETLGTDRLQARSALQRLRDAGLVVQIGERGGTKYMINPGRKGLPEFHFLPQDVDSIIVQLASEGPVTNSRLRYHTGLDRSEALRALSRLVEKGILERVGAKRGTRYILAKPN